MQVKYYAETDSVRLVAGSKGGRGGGDSLRDDFDVVVEYAAGGDGEEVAAVDVFNVGWYLPLRAERGYDAASDTLTLGDKPGDGAAYRVVDNGDFVSYRERFELNGRGVWNIVALDLRHASRHLAAAVGAGRGWGMLG